MDDVDVFFLDGVLDFVVGFVRGEFVEDVFGGGDGEVVVDGEGEGGVGVVWEDGDVVDYVGGGFLCYVRR